MTQKCHKASNQAVGSKNYKLKKEENPEIQLGMKVTTKY